MQKCRKQIPDGSKFCNHCGAPQIIKKLYRRPDGLYEKSMTVNGRRKVFRGKTEAVTRSTQSATTSTSFRRSWLTPSAPATIQSASTRAVTREYISGPRRLSAELSPTAKCGLSCRTRTSRSDCSRCFCCSQAAAGVRRWHLTGAIST